MEKLSLNLKERLLLMEKYRLTAEELLVVELLFLASSEERHKEFLINYYKSQITKTSLRDILTSLQNKGVILKSFKMPAPNVSIDPACIPFNSLFLNNYRKFSGEMGVELLEEYPSIAVIGGTNVSLKNWAKKFATEEDFYYAYGKSIGWKPEVHQHVMELVRWGKETNCNLLNMNIADFAVSRIWKGIEELKDGKGVMTFDTLTSI